MADKNTKTPDGIDVGFTSEELLNEIKQHFYGGVGQRQPGDITAYEFAASASIHPSTAMDKLRELVKKGILVEVKVRGNHGVLTVFRKNK